MMLHFFHSLVVKSLIDGVQSFSNRSMPVFITRQIDIGMRMSLMIPVTAVGISGGIMVLFNLYFRLLSYACLLHLNSFLISCTTIQISDRTL